MNLQQSGPGEGMQQFFTSDHHLGHVNILKYQPNRAYLDIEQMNEALVTAWNSVVTEQDTVYCLGDMSYKADTLRRYLRRMCGTKILIVGNHDPVFKGMVSGDPNHFEAARQEAMQWGFADAHRELSLDVDGVGRVRLSHFPYWPTATAGLEDHALRYPNLRPRQGDEVALLHGHVHSSWQLKTGGGTPPMLNVGVDVWAMTPVSSAQVAEKLAETGR